VGEAGSGIRQGEGTPLAIVRHAYYALARRQIRALEELVHPNVEFRPVDGLGLVGETVHGVAGVRAWLESGGRRFSGEHAIQVRRMEQIDAHHVLAVGVVSQQGRTGGCYAATVAWIWRVSDGLVRSFCGYPSEADARRALSEAA
jgi:ketosteroid isomerase-like protein